MQYARVLSEAVLWRMIKFLLTFAQKSDINQRKNRVPNTRITFSTRSQDVEGAREDHCFLNAKDGEIDINVDMTIDVNDSI